MPASLIRRSNSNDEPQRRLAALMFTDMVGFSALVHANEGKAKEVVDDMYRIVRESVQRFSGREMDTAGDGFFIEFASAVSAIECAYEIQARIHEHNLASPRERNFQIRIGLHIGDLVEVNGHVIGDDVNIAARLEKLAEPGGIAVSQQLADQVAGKFSGQFRKVGYVALKNIAKKVQVLAVQLPWLRKANLEPRSFSRIKRVTPWFGVVSLVLVSLFLGVNFVGLLLDYIHVDAKKSVHIEQGWEIQLSPNGLWLPFSPTARFEFADKLDGRYRMRNRFAVDQPIEEPALVLGTISDRYRIYLNGHLVGGANRNSPVEYFIFDKSFLKIGEGEENRNEIEVIATSGPAAWPGIRFIPQVGAFIGEFSHVYSAVIRDRVIFHGRQLATFTLSVFLFLATLLGWLLNPMDRRRAYHAFYMFFCTVLCVYYLAPIFSGQPYWIGYMCKIVPLTILPGIMISNYFAARGLKRWEMANNFVFVVGTTSLVGLLLPLIPTPSEFFAMTRWTYWLSTIYGISSTVMIGLSTFRILRDKGATSVALVGLNAMVFNFLVSLFAAASVAYLIPPGWANLRYVLTQLSLAFPLIYAGVLGVSTVVDYTRQNSQARRRQAVLLMSRRFLSLLVEPSSFSSKLAKVQSLVCEKLGAEKSTILLAKRSSEDQLTLQVASIVRNREHRLITMGDPFSPREGILGYVCERRTPVLIEDIRRDARFASYMNSRCRMQFYTNSCMLFPLMHKNELVGVLTFADKKDGRAFDQQDFEIGGFSANILQLICQIESEAKSRDVAQAS